MEQLVEKKELICDFCKVEICYEKCLGCGKDACWRCQEKNGIDFKHGVYISGSGDGFFCWACLANPPKHILPKLAAYLKIFYLKKENQSWAEDFDKRSKLAEAELASIPVNR